MGRPASSFLQLAARSMEASSQQEQDSLRVESTAPQATRTPAHLRLVLAASVALPYATASLLAPDRGAWLAVLLLLLLEPLLWELLTGITTGKPWHWLLAGLQALALGYACIGMGLPIGTGLAATLAIAAAGMVHAVSPDYRTPAALLVAVASYPSSPLAWALVPTVLAITLSKAAVLRSRDQERAHYYTERVALLEERVEHMRARQDTGLYDPLTQVLNRRGFAENAVRIFNRARLASKPFGLMMLDIDHFKSVNDTYGHDLGDLALQAFAQTLRETVRPSSDVLARFGGEEFVVITDDLQAEEDLVHFAERVRQAVKSTCWGTAPDGTPLGFTCSIGCAAYPWSGAPGLDELLKLADKALYEAKESGRDQVRLYRPSGS